ncbi:hypothetical protein GGR28_002907 [Lewinella aquimaris]|uniref:DinB-like domain-containing protein n=1 Tax=Neolewinella aquimaris TaxID=1835722 RepID=A0A840EA57_9BACT|nr:DinB family protein [Neolewinella aquimaris]MBB4080277.1 hypothetical protein [Neolewinella aquimaris]
MKSRSTPDLLNTLDARVRQNLELLERLRQLPDEALQRRPGPEAWTALEALEHLNVFNGAYLPRTRRAIERGKTMSPSPTFTSSWLGNVVASWAQPGAKTIKLPTLRKMNPKRKILDRTALDNCLANERELQAMIADARGLDLTGLKIKTIESSLVKLRLGDVLRMLVNHDWRHIEQAERATRGEAGIRRR